VLDHLWDYVEVNTRLVDGVVCDSAGVPLSGRRWWCRRLFYVCPKSGLLKAVRHVGRARQAVAKPAFLVVGERRQWRKWNGIWFEIEVAAVNEAAAEARDALLKVAVQCISRNELHETYGGELYGKGKRQLGKREVRIAERRMAEMEKRSGGSGNQR
jgi:hypothetical protein